MSSSTPASSKNTTKAKIIKTAQKLMWYQGFDGASVNDVAKKSGVSKGAFFHHFPSKQAISLEVLEKYADEQIFRPLEKHLGEGGNIKTELFAWLQESFNAYAQWKFKGGCLLGNMTLSQADRDDTMREAIKHIFLQWENQLVGYLRPAAAQGKLLMEPRQFARLIIAAYEGMIMTAKAHKDPNRASREFQALAEMIERLVKD